MTLFVWLFSISTGILTLYTLKNHAAESFTRLYAYTAMRPFIPDHGMYAAAISFALPPMMVIGAFGKKMKVNWFWTFVAIGIAVVVTTWCYFLIYTGFMAQSSGSIRCLWFVDGQSEI